MKKTFLLSSIAVFVLGLTAFGTVAWKNFANDTTALTKKDTAYQNADKKVKEKPISPVFYGFGPRFSAVKKEKVHNASSIADFLDEEEMQKIVSIQSMEIIVIENEAQSMTRVESKGKSFSAKQLRMLRSFDYSSNFTLQIDYKLRNAETGKIENGHYGPHMSIVPEKQAINALGEKGLNEYMESNLEDKLPIIDSKHLRPTMIYFTVTPEGQVENVIQHNTSGYPSIDAKLNELIRNLPGEWTPAENAKGEKMEQELVFTFGMGGC